MGIRIIIIIFCLIPLSLEARPISYSGGSTIMAFSDDMENYFYYHFSPTYKYSIGIAAVNNKFFNDEYFYGRLTYLLNRKNTKKSQRNLYFKSGISSKDFNNYFYGIHGDWETRRLFLGFGFSEVSNTTKNYNEQYFQFGIAPYLGGYGDLHTWVMLKNKKNTLNNGWESYPVLKFFKGDALMEIGYNKSSCDLHLMFRI